MRSEKVVDLRGGRGAPKRATQPSINFGNAAGRVPLRVRRRRVKVAIALGVILLIAAAIWGISFVSYLPQLSVQTVSVSGVKSVDPQAIADYTQQLLGSSNTFLSRRNIFLYPRVTIEKEIVANFPRVRLAHASRASLFSTTLDILVEEREEYALWCPSTPLGTGVTPDLAQCYKMDETGYVFAAVDVASTTPTSRYIFSGGFPDAAGQEILGRVFAEGHLPGLVVLLTQLGQTGFEPKGITVEGDHDFVVPLVRGYYLKASYGQDADALTRNLQLILGSDALKDKTDEIEYIDLRFGNRVYYKLSSEGGSASGGNGEVQIQAE